jgi:hypothetical protein
VIRVVLAVVLTSALFGIALPSAGRVDRERNAALATAELESIGETAARLAAENDPVAPDRDPAAITVTVDVPDPTFTDGGRIRLRDDELRFDPADARSHTVDPPVPFRVETPIVTTDRIRIRLSFVTIDGRAVVLATPEDPRV